MLHDTMDSLSHFYCCMKIGTNHSMLDVYPEALQCDIGYLKSNASTTQHTMHVSYLDNHVRFDNTVVIITKLYVKCDEFFRSQFSIYEQQHQR